MSRLERLRAAGVSIWLDDIVPGSAEQAMYAVGAIEIAAGVAVALKPRYGAYLVAAWLGGIILNLLTHSGYYDIALRDFGLMIGALSLARLASAYDTGCRRPTTRWARTSASAGARPSTAAMSAGGRRSSSIVSTGRSSSSSRSSASA